MALEASATEGNVMSDRAGQISEGLREHLETLGVDKFTDDMVMQEPDSKDIAMEFLAHYKGDFKFIKDMQEKAGKFELSVPQIRGVLNAAAAQGRPRGDMRRAEPLYINGLALVGRYIMPNNGPTIVIKNWQRGDLDDGTMLVGYIDPISQRTEAFGSVYPGGVQYQIWGRYASNPNIKLICDDFFVVADTSAREEMGKAYAKVTNRCYLCDKELTVEGTAMCSDCSESRYYEMTNPEPGF